MAFLFTAPQLLSLSGGEKPRFILPSKLRYRQSETRKTPSFPSGKKTGKGLGALLTTEPTTHHSGPHGNSVVKER